MRFLQAPLFFSAILIAEYLSIFSSVYYPNFSCWIVMTGKGGPGQACAACRYQRRKCTKDCVLAPYFPADQPKLFLNAHHLFGVSNIMKILKRVPDKQKKEAMESMIYESTTRSRFPVHGCLQVIFHLHLQLQQADELLRRLKARIENFRNLEPQLRAAALSHNLKSRSTASTGKVPPVYQYQSSGVSRSLTPNDFSLNRSHIDPNVMKTVSPVKGSHSYDSKISNDIRAVVTQSQLNVPLRSQIQQEVSSFHDYGDTFLDTFYNEQSNIESSEAHGSRIISRRYRTIGSTSDAT